MVLVQYELVDGHSNPNSTESLFRAIVQTALARDVATASNFSCKPQITSF